MSDLVSLARRAKGSEILPTVIMGSMNAETLMLKLADEIERLRAQHTVQCFWNGNDREIGYGDPSEILQGHIDGAVIEIEHVAVVDTTYEARLPAADDAEYDDDFEVCEQTREAAEAAVSAEIARRDSLATTNP